MLSFFKTQSLPKILVLATSVFLPLQAMATVPEAKADSDNLPLVDDTLEKICSIVALEKRSDLRTLRQVCRRFNRIGGSVIESLRKKTPEETLSLQDDSKWFIEEVIHRDDIKNIKKFNSLEAFSQFLTLSSTGHFHSLWQEEAKAAVAANQEPTYLDDLLALKRKKIATFMGQLRQKGPQTKDLLRQQAYSLLIAMHAYENAAWLAVKDWAQPNTTLWEAAYDGAWNVAMDLGVSSRWQEPWNLASENVWEPAQNAAAKLVSQAIALVPTSEPLQLVYRSAEKVALLYFLKNTEQFLKASFDITAAQLGEFRDRNNRMATTANWSAFKQQCFGALSAAQRQFLSPWLDELDKLVAAIETMAD